MTHHKPWDRSGKAGQTAAHPSRPPPIPPTPTGHQLPQGRAKPKAPGGPSPKPFIHQFLPGPFPNLIPVPPSSKTSANSPILKKTTILNMDRTVGTTTPRKVESSGPVPLQDLRPHWQEGNPLLPGAGRPAEESSHWPWSRGSYQRVTRPAKSLLSESSSVETPQNTSNQTPRNCLKGNTHTHTLTRSPATPRVNGGARGGEQADSGHCPTNAGSKPQDWVRRPLPAPGATPFPPYP